MEDEIKTFLLLSRPNYFNFLYKQDEDLTQEVFNRVVRELESYPTMYRHYFYNFIAVHLAMKGDFISAENYLTIALRMKPNSEITLTNYAILLCESGEKERVETCFAKFDDIAPSLPEVKLDLATLFYLFNLNVAARTLLEDYINSSNDTTNDFVLFLLGKVIMNHSTGKVYHGAELDTAIRIFHEIHKKSPSFLLNTESLVAALAFKWRDQKMGEGIGSVHPWSIVLVNSINTGKYNTANDLFLIGKMRRKVGEVLAAKDVLAKSVAIYPNEKNLYYLGKCHLQLKEISLAAAKFKEAKKLTVFFNVKLVLKEATSLMINGKRTECLRLLGEALTKDISDQDKLLLELFSAELNIVVFPEVSNTLEKAFLALQKGFGRTLYRRFIRVIKLFTEHLSSYYSTSGIPHNQVEILVKWLRFLEERGEITAEQHADFLRTKGTNLLAPRGSNSRKPSNASKSRRRSSSTVPNGSVPGHSRTNSIDSVTNAKPIMVPTDNDKGESSQIKNIKEQG